MSQVFIAYELPLAWNSLSMQKVLAFEIVLKLTAGLVLLFLPRTVGKVFGFTHEHPGLWPRLLGSLLVGISGGVYLETARLGGISVAACALINIIGAVTLIGLLVSRRAADTLRGRFVLGFVATLLIVFALIEISYI